MKRNIITLTTMAAVGVVVLTACGSTTPETAAQNTNSSATIVTSSDAVPTTADSRLIKNGDDPAVQLRAWASNSEGGMGSLDVTYLTPDGTDQSVDVTQSAVKNLMAEQVTAGDSVGVTAQNREAGGTVGCTIEANGTVIVSKESKGAYAVVSCHAIVPAILAQTTPPPLDCADDEKLGGYKTINGDWLEFCEPQQSG